MSWKHAQTLEDLGHCTAAWLEGRSDFHPGHFGRPDLETSEILDHLVSLNRAGYVTTSSQPGADPDPEHDGYQQRAAVEFLADDDHMTRLRELLPSRPRLLWAASKPLLSLWARRTEPGIPVSGWPARDGQPARVNTDFGSQLRTRDLAKLIYQGVPRAAVQAAQSAWHVAVAAPDYGTDDQGLWEFTDTLTANR